MTKIPLLPAGKVINALIRLGFRIDHQKGSHVVLKILILKLNGMWLPLNLLVHIPAVPNANYEDHKFLMNNIENNPVLSNMNRIERRIF